MHGDPVGRSPPAPPGPVPVLKRLLLLVAAALAFAAGAARAENRLALVVGIGRYAEAPNLRNAVGDGRAMRTQLATAGFSVVYREDSGRRAFNQAIDDFVERLSSDSVAVIYYAGHGVQVSNSVYLLPSDIQAGTANDVVNDGIDLTRLLERVAATKARFTLAIIDACRDNPFVGAARSAVAGRGLSRPVSVNGVMVVYSAGAGQTALDRLSASDPDPNGLFTREWLRAMATPGLSVGMAVQQVREAVYDQARKVGHEQMPALYDQSIGSFTFTPAPASPPPSPSVVQAPSPVGPTVGAPARTGQPLERTPADPAPDRLAALGGPPPQKAAPQPDAAGRFQRRPCGSIVDRSTRLEWYVGPDTSMGWAEAAAWVRQLRACDGAGWAMPQSDQLRALYDPRSTAGTGYYTRGRRWPAHIDPAFSGIGEGSWVWEAGGSGVQGAPAFNFNQGARATIPPGTDYTVRAFAVRPARQD